jgi:hypothetical protein
VATFGLELGGDLGLDLGFDLGDGGRLRIKRGITGRAALVERPLGPRVRIVPGHQVAHRTRPDTCVVGRFLRRTTWPTKP